MEENKLVQFRDVLKILRSSSKIKIGFLTVLGFVVVALSAPLINQIRLNGVNPYLTGLFDPWLPPSWEHPLGTELYGRDVLALILSGLGYTLVIGFLAGSVATIIGVSLGLIAGYKGGIVDDALRAFTDGMLVIPTWPILIALCLYMQNVSIFTVAFVLAVFSWPASCRRIRAQVVSLKERPYVEFARVVGLGHIEIVFREIMPNLLPYVGVGFASAIVGSMLAEAGMEMMGFGPVGVCTLGMFMNWAINWGSMARGLYHLIIPPIMVFVILFVAFNLINIGLDDYYNPRLREVTGK